MESILYIGILLLIVVVGKVVEKKFPRFYRRIELPGMIVSTLLMAAYCAFLGYAIYDVMTSPVSGKISFAILIGACIAVYVILAWKMWHDWRKKRKEP